MSGGQPLLNATQVPLEGQAPAAGAYILPSWLTAAASGNAAWVPQPQGWGASVGRLWAALVALPLVSLVVVFIAVYLTLHVRHAPLDVALAR